MADNIVVITTDLSEQSLDAVAEGLQHAAATNAEVRILFACPPFELPIALQRQLSDPEGLRKMEETYESDENERLVEYLKDHKLDKNITPIIKFSEELPSEIIVNYAKEVGASLIVMASHGKSSIGRFFLGSTTQKVVASTPCPVLIVPPVKVEGE